MIRGVQGGMAPVLRNLRRGFASSAMVADQMRAMAAQVPTEVSTMSNGMRVASEVRKGTDMVTVGVHLSTGTRFETPETNGAAHFLEHLIFKGSKKYSQSDIETKAENMGIQLNAYTAREQTVYFATAMKKDVPLVVDLLGDIIRNSKLEKSAVERERDVILRELQEVNQQMDETVFDYLHEVAYQNTPLANTILGTPENIQTLTVDDLRNYTKKHYKPHRMVLAAAGAVDHNDLVKLSEKAFGSMEKETDPITPFDLCTKDPAYVTGSEVRVHNENMPACHFAIAFESVGWTHPDSVAFVVLQSLLGNYNRSDGSAQWSNMRLPRSMAVHADHCLSFSSFNTTYTDTGLFGVYCLAKPPFIHDAVTNITTELVRNVFKIEEAALERAKAKAKMNVLATLDGTQAIADEIGRQLHVYGRRMPMTELFARVDEITTSSMKDIAEQYIYDREIAVAAMGPVWALPEYQWMRRRTYWNSY
mmetsp:Transcript_41806/g.163972  ORF Transcript_41806/g.163972 Transcript_41806/m.163972 type:complete len:477 (-) Transcript_41806:76-1506(-)